jgi:hypothetical protein
MNQHRRFGKNKKDIDEKQRFKGVVGMVINKPDQRLDKTELDATRHKLDELLKKDALTKSEVVWVLDYIKDQISLEDRMLLGLSQARLLTNYFYFAKVSLLLIHQWEKNDQEMDKLILWLKEAVYGLDSDSRRELQSD